MELVWIGLVAAAILLDLLLMQLMRRRAHPPAGPEAVRVFGVYSPILSWLKSLALAGRRADRAGNTLGAGSKLEPGFKEARAGSGALLAGLPPGLALTSAGGMLALLSWTAVRPAPPALLALTLLGAALAGVGLAGRLWPRLALIERGGTAAGGWLHVSPAQAVCVLFGLLLALLAGLLSAGDALRSVNPWVGNVAWAAALALVTLGGWRGGLSSWRRLPWRALAWAAAIALAGFVLRAYDLTHIPVTMTGDEGVSGLSALRFVEGSADNLFGSGWNGFPALHFFIQSLPIAVLGRTIAAARLSAVVAGALTVGGVYLVGRSVFGRRTGLLAAVLLAGFHFHLHFSRIGLNNAWDGLSAVAVLGLTWHAWHTERRASFLLAGLLLGLSQYFYPSARVLAAAVLVWLVIMGSRDRPKLRRLLPDLLLLAVAAAAAVLPLALYFLRHPAEYFGTIRGVSLFGPILDSIVQSSGLPAWRVVLERMLLGLGAYAFVPTKYYYRPETPLLRALPAVLFLAGLAAVVVRSRGGRGLLLSLWLLSFGLIGGLSESTPAAQRFVGAAAAISLVAALGLVQIGVWVARLRPRVARGVPALLVLTAVFLAVDDARFYYLEYTPKSRLGGSFDFEGLGAAVANRLASYLQVLPSDWQVVFFGWPRMGYDSIPSLQFLAPHISGLNMMGPYGSPENPVPYGEQLVFVFLPDNAPDQAAVVADRPGGWLFPVVDGAGQLIFTIYQLPYPANSEALAAAVPVTPPPEASHLPLAAITGTYALLVAAWAAWQWRRTRGMPVRPARLPRLATGELRSALAGWWNRLPAGQAVSAAASSEPAGGATSPEGGMGEAVKAGSGTADSREPGPVPGSEAAGAAANQAAAQSGAREPAGAAAQETHPAPASSPPPARTPRVAQVNVTLNVPPGARLRLQIDDISPDLAEPSPLLTQELHAPSGQLEVPATVAVTFGPISPSQAALPPANAPTAPSLPALAAAPPPKPPPMAAGLGTPGRLPAVLAGWLARAGAVVAGPAGRLRAAWRADTLAGALFAGALLVYALTHLIGLERFPIFFFSDEAVQTVQAADFVANGFRDMQGRYFPTYFQNGPYYNLSVSVYAQVLPYLLWGKSIFVTRAVPALLSLIGVAAVGLALRDVFKARWWWLGVLLLSVTPAWFLHSRTAFETVLMVSFYAWFLYFYLLYRMRHPRFLLPALVAGALAFYSYAGGQMVIVLTGALFGLSDLRYHWANRQWAERGLVLLAFLVLPFIRFQLAQPGESLIHLRTLDSYWLDRDLGLGAKLARLGREYALGLSPGYWLAANNHRDLIRHIMSGYGHLLPVTAPLLLLGLLVCVWRVRQSPYRALLLALLAAPAGGAVTAIGITRVLVLVVPSALLTALGFEFLRARLAARWWAGAGVGVFVLTAGFNAAMLRDALRNGPVWYDDYGLGGMQWGVPQLFEKVIPDMLAADPDVRIYLSPTWANGADLFPRFFLDEDQRARFQMQGPEYYLSELRELPPNHVVILLAGEYERLAADPKVERLEVIDQLPYPNGAPGYVFSRLTYSSQAAALFAAEHAALLVPVTEEYQWEGQLVTVSHPQFGAGQLRDMLDGDSFTLINAPGINPVVFEFEFPALRLISGLTLITGSMADFGVTLEVYTDPNAAPETVSQTFQDLPPDPTITLTLDGPPREASRARVLIQDNRAGAGVNIHVRELALNP